MGTIRREGPVCTGNPQRLDVRDRPSTLEAEWVTGFVDGEGCFHVGISSHPGMRMHCQVLPEFTVVQHERDVRLLRELSTFFGCGVVRKNHGDRAAYRVRKRSDLLRTIVPFFIEHRLQSRKRADFELFRRVLELMELDVHLTRSGVDRIRSLTARMNRGRSR